MQRMRVAAVTVALAAAAGACGGSDPTPELVVRDASLGGASPVVLGATASTVYWTSTTGGTKLVGAAALTSLPANGAPIATAAGPVAHAGDRVLFLAENGITISSVDAAGTVVPIAKNAAETLAGSAASPTVAWTVGGAVSWTADGIEKTTTLTNIPKCDHLRVADRIYVAADTTTGRRLFQIDTKTGDTAPVTTAARWSSMFPGGAVAGATYTGRMVDATDAGVLWLVEEVPSHRGIVVNLPVQGEQAVVFEHVSGASGFFASATDMYWQEGDALLTAPRAGGAASIVATLPGPAGALADGYVYFTDGAAIERLRVE